MNKLNKKDLILIAAIILIAVILLIAGPSTSKRPAAPVSTAVPVATEADAGAEAGADASMTAEEAYAAEAAAASGDTYTVAEEYYALVDEYLAANPAESYVLVQTSGGVFSPIPLAEDRSFKVNFGDDEYNIVHIGKNSVYMEESTCDNQNCVGEGEITLENRDSRVLYNMIVCLPHNLLLELIDASEARDYLAQMYQAEAEYIASLGVNNDAT